MAVMSGFAYFDPVDSSFSVVAGEDVVHYEWGGNCILFHTGYTSRWTYEDEDWDEFEISFFPVELI